ncbi:MAG: hypothetical protein AAFP69_21785, partial [Planctomycetota bacterium]
RDTTARGTVMQELENTTPRRSQYQPGDEIPERSFVYRWAKKYAFNDFGTYARHFDTKNFQDPDAEPADSDSDGGDSPSGDGSTVRLPVLTNTQ